MTKSKLFSIVLTITIAIALSIPTAMAAEVVQGKCVAIDMEKKTYTIEIYGTAMDKDHPYGRSTNKNIVINYSKAQVGKDPDVGNILRIAYKIEGTNNMAIRVMNVTKQDIMNK